MAIFMALSGMPHLRSAVERPARVPPPSNYSIVTEAGQNTHKSQKQQNTGSGRKAAAMSAGIQGRPLLLPRRQNLNMPGDASPLPEEKDEPCAMPFGTRKWGAKSGTGRCQFRPYCLRNSEATSAGLR